MSKPKINILIIAANGLGKTGVPNVIFQVVSALSMYAVCDVVVFNDEDYYAGKIAKYGGSIIKVNEKQPTGKLKRFLWRCFFEKKIHHRIFKSIFSDKKYDIVHSFKEYDSAFIFEEATKHGVIERIIHCNNEIKMPSNYVSKLFLSKKIKIIKNLTTKLVGVSSNCCIKSYPGMEYMVIYNSYDNDRYVFSKNNQLSNNVINIIQVATFSSRKNQLFTIKVISELLKTNQNVKLFLAGTEVEKGYLDRINDSVKELNIEKYVTILDGSKDFDHIYKIATFLVLPSLHEAAPITLVEAQACGIFCFASDSITKEMDCGGIKYLPITSPSVWKDEIISCFNEKGNKRERYDVDRFSSYNFEKKMKELYGIK